MKKLFMFLALGTSLLGTAVAGTTPSATATAREIAQALQLNEEQYLKVKSLVNLRLELLKASNGKDEQINEKFKAALLQELNLEQQKAYMAFVKEHAMQQVAQVK